MYSASAGGPRGQAGLSPQWLSSSENAIWLCETHGKLVDNNRGKEYPPAVLVGYKALHEMRIIRRQRGIIVRSVGFTKSAYVRDRYLTRQ